MKLGGFERTGSGCMLATLVIVILLPLQSPYPEKLRKTAGEFDSGDNAEICERVKILSVTSNSFAESVIVTKTVSEPPTRSSAIFPLSRDTVSK